MTELGQSELCHRALTSERAQTRSDTAQTESRQSSDTAQTEPRQSPDRAQTEPGRRKLKHKQASQHARHKQAGQHARHKPRRRALTTRRQDVAPARLSSRLGARSKQASNNARLQQAGRTGRRACSAGNYVMATPAASRHELAASSQQEQTPTYRVAVNEKPAQLHGLVPIVGQLANSIVGQIGHLQLQAHQATIPPAPQPPSPHVSSPAARAPTALPADGIT